MSDSTSDRLSDTPPPPRPPVGRSQREILERAYHGITHRFADVADARLIPSVTGIGGAGGSVLKVEFDGGETWWVTAVRSDQ